MEPEINPIRSARAEYQARRRLQSVDLYFRSPEELAQHRAAAEAGGYSNFNAWLLQMLANATSGTVYPPEYVGGLKREVDKLRGWLDTARDEASDYRVQVKLLQAQRDTLLTLLHGLPEGGEVAAMVRMIAFRQAGRTRGSSRAHAASSGGSVKTRLITRGTGSFSLGSGLASFRAW